MKPSEVALKFELRSTRGNGAARRLRRTGRVPAVMYGHGEPGQPVSVDELALKGVLHHPGLIQIEGADNQKLTAIIKEVQRNCISGQVLHVDFQEVRADEIITSSVDIEPLGDPAGIQAGGQLEQVMRRLEIRVRAGDLFEVLKVDVTEMQLGAVMHVGDLKLPEGVTTQVNKDAAVFQVRLPKMEVEEPEAAAEGDEASTSEPEVIAKGKKDEEEGEAGAAPAAGAKPKEKEKEKKK